MAINHFKTSYEVFKGATVLRLSHPNALWNHINEKTRARERDIKMGGGYVTVLTDLSMRMHR